MTVRTCPRCGYRTTAPDCCGVDLTVRRRLFHMSKAEVRQLRGLAHKRKGLDDDTFRLHLHQVGVEHTYDLTRAQYQRLLQLLNALPDVPSYAQGRAA